MSAFSDDCWECGGPVSDFECLDCGACFIDPPPPEYETELACRMPDWDDRANDKGFPVGLWLKRHYQSNDLVHLLSIRATPFLTSLST